MSGNVVGRYVVHDEVASGGMASVCLGRMLGPVGFARTVAIKRLHPQFAKDPEFVSMFLDEARLAARIRHPNVVATIDVVALSGELFLVMEYVQGETLSRLIRAASRVPVEIAVTIVADSLYGLHAAHEAKSERGEPLDIVHRDVSPQNIIVGKDGIARVLDFGIAKAASRIQTTSEGQLKGKLAYMSPEQILRKPVDRRTDVYAASIVLWESLTGQRLFAADNHGAVVNRILSEPVAKPSSEVSEIPAALDDVVMKGLARDPDERWSTAKEMATALEAVVTPARPARVGEWVERTAGDTLHRRARRVAEIEESGSDPSGPSTSEAGTMLLTSEHPLTEPVTDLSSSASVPAKTKRRGLAVAAIALVAAIGAVALAAGLRKTPEPKATASTAPPVVSLSSQPSIAPPPPPIVSAPEPTVIADAGVHPSITVRPKTRPKLPDCNPPYFYDSDGVKHFKTGCI